MRRSLRLIGDVSFPASTNRSVNMMPFIMGDHSTIPYELRDYIPMIVSCGIEPEQIGKVGYLSVMESVVTSGLSQRRPGIHTEKHPSLKWGGGWGHGASDGAARRDGVYMASTVSDSCRAWDFHVKVPGYMGDCEHLRKDIESTPLTSIQANKLYWMTDSCPHESMPIAHGTLRQWFRLVTHKVGLWYAKHSTPSPFGVLPKCPIIWEDKFEGV
jgi:hypothetical protein